MQWPETLVTKHSVADLVHCFPDDSMSHVCDVFAQYARQHNQEQQVRAWAEQLMGDMRVETVCMNGSDSVQTYEQLVKYVNQDLDILLAELYWTYHDTASKKCQLDQLWQWIQQLSEGPDCPPPPAPANATQPGGSVLPQQNAAGAALAAVNRMALRMS